jgi:uncharacterized RDD family membrane protein YckC
MSNLTQSEAERAATRRASVTPAGARSSVSEFSETLPSVPPDRPLAVSADGDRIVGMEIDHFHVEKRVGSGGMGAVYLAHDMSLDRPVAIKVLPDVYAVNPEAQERFIHEARAQARIVSPHIVRIYYIGRVPRADDNSSKSLYFAMEYVEGGSFEGMLERRENLDPEKARRWMIEAVRGLKAAYAAGLVHRDIKPGNMLIDQQGHLKIADFGLAKPMGAKPSSTLAGTIVGTPLYISPEQVNSKPLDHRADMYSLGCAFYHLVTGKPPFEGEAPFDVISKHLRDTPPSMLQVRPDISPRFAIIFDRLMAKNPDERYATHEELLAALEAAAPEAIEYAGFWTRGAAVAMDTAIASALVALLRWPGIFVYLTYVVLTHAYFGQTFGKWALHIEVKRLDGRRLGLLRGLIRTAASLWGPIFLGVLILSTQGISAFTSSIGKLAELDEAKALLGPVVATYVLHTLLYGGGIILAAFNRKRRAFHDFCAGSHVLYKFRAPVAVKVRN